MCAELGNIKTVFKRERMTWFYFAEVPLALC